MTRSSARGCAATVLVCAGAVLALVVPSGAAAADPAQGARIERIGSVDVGALASRAKRLPSASPVFESPAQVALRERDAMRSGPAAAAATQAASSLQPPVVPGSNIVTSAARRGFEGLANRDSYFANGFEVEPPSQGLCGGTSEDITFLFQSVNLAVSVFDTSANQYSPPVSLNAFFRVPPVFDPTNNSYGPVLRDPKCYFDPDTQRWFHTVSEIDVDPATGELGDRAATLIAVSQSDNPLGDYTIYSIDATGTGRPHCPCYGDQPLLGADASGFYVSTAETSIKEDFSNGAQIYALDKRALEAGRLPAVVHLDTGTAYTGTVQPATAPTGRYETRRGGTEYFMSAFDCLPPDCRVDPEMTNRITVWALANTSSLGTATPSVELSSTTIRSEVYGRPVPQVQPDDPGPLAQALAKPAPQVGANDARMNQVVFARGRLWAGINTVVSPGPRDGIAWFVVNPWIFTGKVHATIGDQGYIAARSGFASFPSIGVDDTGRGVVAYTVMGPQVYPSAGYSRMTFGGVTGPVRIARRGVRAEDGSSCFPEFLPGLDDQTLCRWGDYSTSFALPNGDVWSAVEFIGDAPRTRLANWSTFIWPVQR